MAVSASGKAMVHAALSIATAMTAKADDNCEGPGVAKTPVVADLIPQSNSPAPVLKRKKPNQREASGAMQSMYLDAKTCMQ
jgi:hypothetical protein